MSCTREGQRQPGAQDRAPLAPTPAPAAPRERRLQQRLLLAPSPPQTRRAATPARLRLPRSGGKALRLTASAAPGVCVAAGPKPPTPRSWCASPTPCPNAASSHTICGCTDVGRLG
ncbi:unnamed protein product [Rangifer tarandus platyrhynchus]|uniref:Uncharacterized protein n=1 Tax=Rangifer tarandus platyrhynchus TaxID=3082113 RepID=A0AC59YC45_RANTA